jgi:hypothetical protein
MTALPKKYRIGEEHRDPQTALEIVENFEILVSRERLMRGVYMSSPAQELAVNEDQRDVETALELEACGALCGGARACAMGTLHLATGRGWQMWPGSNVFNSQARLMGTPLGQAMAALDEAAVDYAKEHGLSEHLSAGRGRARPIDEYSEQFETHVLEELFENPSVTDLETLPETPSKIEGNGDAAMSGVMLEIARRAKELLA